MLEMFEFSFMVNALLACIAFGLLLGYFGIHVVGRGIVFVDLALGQISSLGVAITEFTHLGENWLPIAFTLLGAILLSLIHISDPRIKLEAVIGIIYVVASAVTILIISKTPHGEANIQEVLFGALLAVTVGELIHLGIIFGFLSLLHFVFQKHIYAVTERMQAGNLAKLTWKEQGWNFFFYISIGLAIVYAVRVGGVLPVFAYLVVPAVSSLMVSRTKWVIVSIALFNVAIASFIGLWMSYTFDFPAGPSIVAMFGMMFLGAVIYRLLQSNISKSRFNTANKN
jgi:zinc/manganese transport system permease protein